MRILVQGQGGRKYKTGGASEANALCGKYIWYFEAFIFVPNAAIGQKGAFEIASKGLACLHNNYELKSQGRC